MVSAWSAPSTFCLTNNDFSSRGSAKLYLSCKGAESTCGRVVQRPQTLNRPPSDKVSQRGWVSSEKLLDTPRIEVVSLHGDTHVSLNQSCDGFVLREEDRRPLRTCLLYKYPRL